MSLGVSTRLKFPRKHELMKSHSHSQLLATKLKQDGVMSTVENVMQAVDQVAALLATSTIDNTICYKESIINLCQHLKVYGAYLEMLYQDQLNRAFVVFRNSSQDDIRLDYLSRLHLLELIELRANGWKGTNVMNQYYRKKENQCAQIEGSDSTNSLTESMTSMSMSSNMSPSLLGPGEIIKPSGKFAKPTRIPGKNYCKDEVVIRNADSGKVMGIKGRRVHMIEELSETIISFQRVNPGAKERLVQITGANEESINHAKQLIEDTIKRNASPVREHGIAIGGPLTGSSSSINSSASDESALPQAAKASRSLLHSLSTNDANIGEYKYTVVHKGHTIKITGDDLELVRISKLVLDEYFSGEPLQDVGQFYSFDSLPQPIVTSTTESSNGPLSPPESLPSPQSITNGQNDEATPIPLRRPRLSIEDIVKRKMSPECDRSNLTYSIEYLVRLAMSPFCLVPPNDWEQVTNDYPSLVRKVVEYFDAKQYFSNRSDDRTVTVLSTEEIDSNDDMNMVS